MKYKKQVGAVLIGSMAVVSGVSAYQIYPRQADIQPLANIAEEIEQEEEVIVEKKPSETIEVPTESQPRTSQSTLAEPATVTADKPAVPTNPYPDNSPTGYVYAKRVEHGKTAGAWGSQETWPSAARNQGIAVDTTPRQYDALFCNTNTTPIKLRFVESVSAGRFTTTAFNLVSGTIQTETFTTEDITKYDCHFIH